MTLAQDLLDFETEARHQAEGLEAQNKLPRGFVAKHYPLTRTEARELRRLKTAGLLSDGPDTFVALVREQRVPRAWLERRLRELGI